MCPRIAWAAIPPAILNHGGHNKRSGFDTLGAGLSDF